MNAKRTPPKPIFDNLEFIDDPFKQSKFNTKSLVPDELSIKGLYVDYEYAWKFIYSYNGSSATFNSYRREVERFLHWSWLIKESNIITLKRNDIEDYIKYCQKPPMAWIGTKNVSRFKNSQGERIINPDWHPFVVSVSKDENAQGLEPNKKQFSLSQSALQAIFSILSSFYNYLIQEDVATLNPVVLIRQKSKFIQKNQEIPTIKRISNLQWEFVLEVTEQLADEFPNKYERTLFIMNCLFGMYLRISELVADERSTPTMGDFVKDLDGNWWFRVTGKGNKNREVTVSNEILKSLKRYRIFLNLSALPHRGEQTALIKKNLGQGPVTSTRQIRILVQEVFDLAFEKMKEEGFEDDASDLRSATVHWLRHTGISEDVKNRPREHVRDDAGHSSMATTDKYIESDRRERHASGKKKRMIPG